jgi:transglutaminase-like putative cysteine protease
MTTSERFKRLICVFLSAVIATSLAMSSSGDQPYAVSKIPDSFREKAGAVVRLMQKTFTVKNERRAVETFKYVVTVFRKEDRDNGVLQIPYDKFTEVEALEGAIYGADGMKIRELEKSDTKDFPAFVAYSLFDDVRVREANLYYDQYPYTVEFTYELSYDGYLTWPTWYSRLSRDPVQVSTFSVTVPGDSTLRWWCSRDSIVPTTRKESKNTYEWSIADQRKIEREAIDNNLEDCSLVVRIAPSEFTIGGTSGDMRNWKDFGRWGFSLYRGRDQLSQETVADIQSLVQPSDEPKEKIRKLYEYMQARTRYVSVQLGIGGWQPFDASYVHERGYGDCKALSNYTIALLKVVGITAYPVLVRSGDYRITLIPGFPSNQFNHVVVCVPLPQDTVWLECTSQSIPMGHLGNDTENRSGLILTPDGGSLIRMPSSSPIDNAQIRSALIVLDFFGDAKGKEVVSWHGDQQDRIRQGLEDESPDGRLLWAIRSLVHPNVKLNGYTIDGLAKHQATVSMSAEFSVPRFASASEARLFFSPNVMERRSWVPPELSRRLTPMFFEYPYLDVDSILYILPSGFKTEDVPLPVELQSSFGTFSEKSVMRGDTAIQFVRRLEIRKYSVPASGYGEYRKFFNDIVRTDRGQVVLVKKPN